MNALDSQPTQSANLAELRHQARVAADRVLESGKPKILTWNGEKLVATSTDAKRATKAIEQPTCLGVYDFDVTADQILGDLLVVVQQSKVDNAC